MGTKMKGLLKGLRYISQIFETNEKEREMEIGYPTDVKHVAHIGWDGPSTNNPSWMSEFRSAPELSSASLAHTGTVMDPVPGPKSASQDLQRLVESENSVEGSAAAPRQARRHRASGGVPGEGDSQELVKPSRRRPSIDESSELMAHDQLPKPLKPSRRRANHGSGALDSPTKDSAGVPRQSRRRQQSKGSSGGSVEGSTAKATRARASLATTEEKCEPAKAAEENEPAC